MERELNFDPLDRAESMMAKASVMNHAEGTSVADGQREAVRDLILLAIARSLRHIGAAIQENTEWANIRD